MQSKKIIFALSFLFISCKSEKQPESPKPYDRLKELSELHYSDTISYQTLYEYFNFSTTTQIAGYPKSNDDKKIIEAYCKGLESKLLEIASSAGKGNSLEDLNILPEKYELCLDTAYSKDNNFQQALKEYEKAKPKILKQKRHDDIISNNETEKRRDELAKNTMDERVKFAKDLRNSYLDDNLDIKVDVSGKYGTTITMTYALMNDVYAHKLEKSPVLSELRKMGFIKIILSDGYNYKNEI